MKLFPLKRDLQAEFCAGAILFCLIYVISAWFPTCSWCADDTNSMHVFYRISSDGSFDFSEWVFNWPPWLLAALELKFNCAKIQRLLRGFILSDHWMLNLTLFDQEVPTWNLWNSSSVLWFYFAFFPTISTLFVHFVVRVKKTSNTDKVSFDLMKLPVMTFVTIRLVN